MRLTEIVLASPPTPTERAGLARAARDLREPGVFPRLVDAFLGSDRSVLWVVEEGVPGEHVEGSTPTEDELLAIAEQSLAFIHALAATQQTWRGPCVTPSALVRRDDGSLAHVGVVAAQLAPSAEQGPSPFTAPEVQDGSMTESAELYALGATLVALLGGALPARPSDAERGSEIRRVTQHHGLRMWLARMTAPVPHERYASALEAAEALRELRSEQAGEAGQGAPAPEQVRPDAETPRSLRPSEPRPFRLEETGQEAPLAVRHLTPALRPRTRFLMLAYMLATAVGGTADIEDSHELFFGALAAEAAMVVLGVTAPLWAAARAAVLRRRLEKLPFPVSGLRRALGAVWRGDDEEFVFNRCTCSIDFADAARVPGEAREASQRILELLAARMNARFRRFRLAEEANRPEPWAVHSGGISGPADARLSGELARHLAGALARFHRKTGLVRGVRIEVDPEAVHVSRHGGFRDTLVNP